MTPHRPAHTPRRPAHLSRTRDPAPWSRQATHRHDPPPSPGSAPTVPTPVFVDDSGRRRRAGRLVAGGVAIVAVSYLTVVGLTFAGAPIVGHLAPPGIDQLARPAGDDGAGVGPGPQEAPLPAAADPAASEGTTTTTNDDQAVTAPAPPSPATTAASPTTTTTTTAVPPGQGATTTVPSPSSTVPDRTAPGGGPPDQPPGKP